MLTWIIQVLIISTIIIFLLHHIIIILKDTLTIPKIKDLANSSKTKYDNIYNIINTKQTSCIDSNSTDENYTLIDLLPNNNDLSMKNELKNFLKTQLDNLNDSKTEFINEII
jgi:hypothetical protein